MSLTKTFSVFVSLFVLITSSVGTSPFSAERNFTPSVYYLFGVGRRQRVGFLVHRLSAQTDYVVARYCLTSACWVSGRFASTISSRPNLLPTPNRGILLFLCSFTLFPSTHIQTRRYVGRVGYICS